MTESGGYGKWADRALSFDDELKVTNEEQAWTMTLVMQLKSWCREHPSYLRKKGIQAKSNALVFEKYTVEDATK